MKKIEIAYEILSESRRNFDKYAATGRDFDLVQAHMYSIFECYAHGVIDWRTVEKKFQKSLKEYVQLYKDDKQLMLEEKARMLDEYIRVLEDYKSALDEYKRVHEQKMVSNIVVKKQISESVAQEQSNFYFNKRALKEADLKDITTLKTWKRVIENYPNLTAKDEQRVRMLTIFEGPTVDTTQLITSVVTEYGKKKKKKKKKVKEDNIGRRERAPNGQMSGSTRGFEDPGFEFNPRAGHRDQPSHPENRGLTPSRLAPSSSPRPRLRPGSDRSTSPRPRLRPESVNEDDRRVVFDVIDSAAKKYGVSPAIARGMAAQESGFNQAAVGDDGTAFGIFQVRQPAIDDVNRVYGTNFTIDDVKDINKNADVAMRYFKMQKDTYGAEDDRTALMMYNGGPGILRRGQKAQSMASKHADRVIKKSAKYTPPAVAQAQSMASKPADRGANYTPPAVAQAQSMASKPADRGANYTPPAVAQAQKKSTPRSSGPDKASIDKAVRQAIAYTGNVTYQDLAKASGIKDPNKIFPGQEIVLPGGSNYTVRKGDTLGRIAQRYNKGRLGEGYKVLPPIDRDRYQERDGLEGPFSTLSGKVVYYDPKEGAYYDPDTDMYMSYGEFKALDNDYGNMKDERDIDVKEEMSNDEVDAFHRALDALVHKHIGHGSHEKDDVDESEGKFDGHDIMSEDPPNGIDFDYANLSKVNWAQYSEEDIKTFYRIVDNLSFESGYYNDGDFDDSHFNALRWLEKNVMNKTEAKRRPDHNMQAQMRLQKIMQQAIKDSKKKRGIEDDEKDRADETTSAGGIASVAAPMGKMRRRKDTIFASKEKESGTWYKDGVEMCSKECCGQPVTECTCGPECKHCDCYEKNKAMNESAQMMTEAQFDEAAGEKDACYHKVKSRYKVWPSAYASGALVQCRKVGAKNWGNKSKK